MRRKLIILGDSYSTFEGYNPKGQDVFYPGPHVDDVLQVEDTWWDRLIREQDLELLLNDSYSGSTVCKDVREPQPPESSFLVRMRWNLSAKGYQGQKPDVILIFGGTNDSWLDRQIGDINYGTRTEEELWQILPAFCEMIQYVHKENPDAKLVVIINTELKPEVAEGIAEICVHEGVAACRLKDIDKQNGHPTKLGMWQIATQVGETLK